MPRWVAKCSECGFEHTHSMILADGPIADYFIDPKPDIPVGTRFDCPNCGEMRGYTKVDLVYRS